MVVCGGVWWCVDKKGMGVLIEDGEFSFLPTNKKLGKESSEKRV